ncbi:MAG: cupin domain-containing protein [Candidatus Latescibacterota bacterium]|nr:cupin domain-containing protein [Candidatus Latescibacterota bacterium]
MPFEIFSHRRDLKNLLVTPQIRARFLKIEPGEVHDMHSHDLGHEIFLILKGRLRFYIEGDEATVSEGELCIATSDQIHQVKNETDESVVMYLSVTPHIQPTHTGRDADGRRHSTKFVESRSYDVTTDETTPIDDLIDLVDTATKKIESTSRTASDNFSSVSRELKTAISLNKTEDADRIREIIWNDIRQIHKDLYKLSELWNDLAPRAGSI